MVRLGSVTDLLIVLRLLRKRHYINMKTVLMITAG